MNPKITKFWTNFGAILGSILGPKIAPKGDQKIDQKIDHFWVPPKMAPRAEGKAETESEYRGCTFYPALCCWATPRRLICAALSCFGLS